MIKKFLASVIILPLMLVPLFCCCIKLASAAGTVADKSCHDGSNSHDTNRGQSNSKNGHACDCAKLLSTTGDQPVVFNSDSFSKFQASFDSVSVEPFSIVSLKGSMRMAYLGPPSHYSEVPLYTLYHSLRI